MENGDWVNVTEFGGGLSEGIISAWLKEADIPSRVWEARDSAGQCVIWVPTDRESEAQRILSEASITEKEITGLALADPPPDDVGPGSLDQGKSSGCIAKAFVAVAGIIFGGIALLTLGSLVHLANPCVSTLLWEVPSPDARLKVTVIRRQCSGTSVGAVSILSATRFIGRMAGGNVLADVEHPEALSIRWEGGRTVVIGYRLDDALKLPKSWFMSEYGRVNVRLEATEPTQAK